MVPDDQASAFADYRGGKKGRTSGGTGELENQGPTEQQAEVRKGQEEDAVRNTKQKKRAMA